MGQHTSASKVNGRTEHFHKLTCAHISPGCGARMRVYMRRSREIPLLYLDSSDHFCQHLSRGRLAAQVWGQTLAFLQHGHDRAVHTAGSIFFT